MVRKAFVGENSMKRMSWSPYAAIKALIVQEQVGRLWATLPSVPMPRGEVTTGEVPHSGRLGPAA